jgi:histidinol-phosphate/aromatic aminotransferase/cobyric acid decarboxylase-like protein
VRRCRVHRLFVRDVGGMGHCLGDRALRITVKDAATNERMASVLLQVSA